jgi:hypothetical protein
LLVEIALQKDLEAIVVALRGIGVLTNKLEVESSAISEERTYSFAQVAFFGKYNRWPTLEEAKKFDKTLDVEPLVKAREE